MDLSSVKVEKTNLDIDYFLESEILILAIVCVWSWRTIDGPSPDATKHLRKLANFSQLKSYPNYESVKLLIRAKYYIGNLKKSNWRLLVDAEVHKSSTSTDTESSH